ncbi:hypothetical protein FBQ82_00980 [Anaerolineae bacterium CFX7]|nr:hypothetical protein [Anaerolineae bacterium CFX7]
MNIAVSITEGRTVRDLFYNGLLDNLLENGFDSVTIFTEAVRVPEFIREWKRPEVEFASLLPCDITSWRQRAFWMRRRLVRLHSRVLLQAWIKWEERRLYPPRQSYLDAFKQRPPALLLTTHAHLFREAELISAAHHLGIPTLGVVRSWDNVHKGIRSRPRRLAVWNQVNQQEVIELEGYLPNEVDVIGSPQFDPYFAPDTIWSREKFAAHFQIDPARPILLFATLGNFFPELDETCWMDVLLGLIDQGAIPGSPQVICRLHPWSRLEQFQKYAAHPDVRLSYVERYVPSLQWYMTRADVVLMANMLEHAAIVITPGSTVTLEAAIFDRPTLVPIFHPYQPERAKSYFSTWVLGKHFGRIESLDLAPIIRRVEDFPVALRRCLLEPSWYREKRAQLVRDYVTFTDGSSVKRLGELARRTALKRV